MVAKKGQKAHTPVCTCGHFHVGSCQDCGCAAFTPFPVSSGTRPMGDRPDLEELAEKLFVARAPGHCKEDAQDEAKLCFAFAEAFMAVRASRRAGK